MSRSRPPKCPNGRGCGVCRSAEPEHRPLRRREELVAAFEDLAEHEHEREYYWEPDACLYECCGVACLDTLAGDGWQYTEAP